MGVGEYRDYHMPYFGKALNLTSWDWWFHVFTDTYIKTMLDYDLPEEVRERRDPPFWKLEYLSTFLYTKSKIF